MTPSKELLGVVGFIALLLNYFKINIGESELQAAAGALLLLYTLVKSWVERYQKGEISLGGMNK